MNRPEVQNKGMGSRKHPVQGTRYAPSGSTSHHGIMRDIRANKRAEAIDRNSRTAPDKRRNGAKRRKASK